MEALEDFEDILKFDKLSLWSKNDSRLWELRKVFEGFPTLPSNLSTPSYPSISVIKEVFGGLEGKEGLEMVLNYLIDLLIRSGYLLDKQMNSLEKKHEEEGGYSENLLKRRLEYRKKN